MKRNKPCQGKVYMFHEINDNKGLYSISKNDFEVFLLWLINNKKIITVEEMKNDKDRNGVVLTFDDAYASVYKNAYPLLKELKVPYYIFLNNELLDKENYITKSMIEEMISDSECILGSHGLKHVLSRSIEDDIFRESLLLSKKQLEEQFNVKISDFAFPYGSMYACSKKNIEIASKVFENIFMTYNLSYNKEYNNIIPRVNINCDNYSGEMK